MHDGLRGGISHLASLDFALREANVGRGQGGLLPLIKALPVESKPMRRFLIVVASVLRVAPAKGDLFSSPEKFVEEAKQYDFRSDPVKLGFPLSIEEPRLPNVALVAARATL